MKTKMSPESLAAYWRMRDAGELPEKERKVYYAVAQHGPMTREQIAIVTSMKEGSACGRVNRLIHDRHMLQEVGSVINSVTGNPNALVDIADHRKAPPCIQEQLFPELVAA